MKLSLFQDTGMILIVECSYRLSVKEALTLSAAQQLLPLYQEEDVVLTGLLIREK